MRIKDDPSREDVLNFVSDSTIFGNLGLFIGAGFSKAVLNDPFHNIALSWGDLLTNVAGELGIDYDTIQKGGRSFPEIATMICEEYSKNEGTSYEKARSKLKREIAQRTSWYPDKASREKYAEYLNQIKPKWIITTNYELVLEALLTGGSLTLGPEDELLVPNDLTPIYHLHGLRTAPESIIITQEDYVSLFRPSEYRQLKLSLTIKESTTLILGYRLGDVNVLTAMDWSRNVFPSKESQYPQDVVQVYRRKTPSAKPYRDRNGIVVVETSEIEDFLGEFVSVLVERRTKHQKHLDALGKLSKKINDPAGRSIARFIDDKGFRDGVLKILAENEIYFITGFMEFLFSCIDETWVRAKPKGAFEAYNQNLIILLDILISFSVNKMPPALFQSIAEAFENVAYFVDDRMGKSLAAHRTWRARKTDLPVETVIELRTYAEQQQNSGTLRLLRGL